MRDRRANRFAVRSVVWLAVLWAAAVMIAGPGAAHRQSQALSVIEFNPRTGAIEVIHRLNLHDLDHVFSQRLGKAITVGDSRESLEAVAAHIGKAFSLTDLEGEPIELEVAGMEIVRGDLVAYYQAPRPPGLEGFVVTDTLLMPDLPDQINRVNVELPSGVKTLIFSDREGPKTVALDG